MTKPTLSVAFTPSQLTHAYTGAVMQAAATRSRVENPEWMAKFDPIQQEKFRKALTTQQEVVEILNLLLLQAGVDPADTGWPETGPTP